MICLQGEGEAGVDVIRMFRMVDRENRQERCRRKVRADRSK